MDYSFWTIFFYEVKYIAVCLSVVYSDGERKLVCKFKLSGKYFFLKLFWNVILIVKTDLADSDDLFVFTKLSDL